MRTLAKNSDNEALVDYVEYVRNELNDYQVLLRSYLLWVELELILGFHSHPGSSSRLKIIQNSRIGDKQLKELSLEMN